MELEIYEAFISAGVKEDKAKAVVESINKEIDKRYSLHAEKLATRGDISDVKKDLSEMEARLLKSLNEFQKWSLTVTIASMTFLVAVIKLF